MTSTQQVAGVADPVDAAVLDALALLARLDALRLELQARGDVAGLARVLVAAGELALNVSMIGDSAEAEIAELMRREKRPPDPETGEIVVGVSKMTVDGVGELVRKPRRSTTYDSGGLFRLVLDRALDDGNCPDEVRTRLLNVLSEAIPLTPSLQWRKAGLKKLDVDLDEYTFTTYGRDRIEIR